MKTKHIPAMVMLLGGSVACVVSYINHYNLREMLVALMTALLVFLILGVIIRLIFDSFKMPDEDKVNDEGEVVEKQVEGDKESEEDDTSESEEES